MSIDREPEEQAQSLRFLDANIFIRHLTNDHPVHSPACFALIQAIEQGTIQAWTSDLAISEVVYVLTSKALYNVSRDVIRDLLLPLIELSGLMLPNKRLYRRVFDLYTSLPIDYADAYNAALMESRKQFEVYSYDNDFDRIPGIKRLEPSVDEPGS
jgi:predicted nucleic acid-binding protein